jgi:16S rRNA (adenine1518-N6/adenine1519-N6)-dimethyltransferase
MGAPYHRARKRFGQHFLHDPNVLDRIVRAVQPLPNDRLVEIGPGRGALTRILIEAQPQTLDAIEIDRDLAESLREEFSSVESFTLHENDALDFDFGTLAELRGGPLRVIGNLPYNISTPLLFHLLQNTSSISDIHVMLQREVVTRMAAKPGSGDYGRLTVMLAPWVRVERLFDVGPGAFQPPPQVWSSVVRLVIRPEPAFAVSPRFANVVSAAFSHRRKTLRNALKGLVTGEQIEECNLDPGVRPEEVSPEQFNTLARASD